MIKRDPGSLQIRNHLVRDVLAFGDIPTIFLTCFTFARAASASSIKSVFVAVEILLSKFFELVKPQSIPLFDAMRAQQSVQVLIAY